MEALDPGPCGSLALGFDCGCEILSGLGLSLKAWPAVASELLRLCQPWIAATYHSSCARSHHMRSHPRVEAVGARLPVGHCSLPRLQAAGSVSSHVAVSYNASLTRTTDALHSDIEQNSNSLSDPRHAASNLLRLHLHLGHPLLFVASCAPRPPAWCARRIPPSLHGASFRDGMRSM